MRSILVYADRGPSMSARLETGLALARANNGHVTVLIDTPVTRYVSMDPMGGSYVASDALQKAMADDDAQAEALAARLASEDVSFDIVRSEAEPVEALSSAARFADVVVLCRGCRFAGEVALLARTPVLVLPARTPLTVPVGPACVAWDGGAEAALALRYAVLLLRASSSVTVITVEEKPGGFPATDALRYLSRHGIKAELQELARTGSTEETISAAVARQQGQLLVMGAYGHSRMREYLFGGVTRYFLDDSQSPALLLAH